MGKVIVSLLMLLPFGLFGQSYPVGLVPYGLNWRQISTPRVQVIYPVESAAQAQRVANLVHLLYDSTYYKLGDKQDKVSIILQNQTIVSNGFVTVGPFRSEFFLTSPQYNFSGATNWVDLLAIHEYRHVEQFTNARVGLTGLTSRVFGQYGWAFMAGLALPRWFFEGDAVFYETALTNAGRGRMPAFENEYRALRLSGRNYGYEKASATSFKHFVPNHYNLGYQLTSHLRKNYGDQSWENVVQDAVRYRGLIYPFSRAVKQQTGMRMPAYYRATMRDLDAYWTSTDYGKTDQSQTISGEKKTFTHYVTPWFLSEYGLIVEKSAFNEIPTFYRVDKNGKETKITSPGIFQAGNARITGNADMIVWSEMAFDKRWGNRDYSVVVTYDLNQKIKTRITEESKYFAPALSPDGRNIAAIHTPENQQVALHVLTLGGHPHIQIEATEFDNMAFPVWKNDQQIIMVVKKQHQNALAELDLVKKEWKLITPFWDEQIGYPVYQDQLIYFTGLFGGMENIFCFDLKETQLYQVTDSPFGARHATVSPSGKQMVFAAYTADGYELKKLEIERDQWKSISTSNNQDFPTYYTGKQNILADIPDSVFAVSPFNYNKKLINPHSWSPWFLPPNGGVTLYADNLMSTMSASADYTYNINEKTGSFGVNFEYGAFFPAFQVGVSQANRNRYVPVYFEVEDEQGEMSPRIAIAGQQWQETAATVGMTLPFNLTKGNFFSRFWLSNRYHQKWVQYQNPETGTDDQFGAYELDIDFFAVRRTALQQILPRLGMTFNLNYQKTIATEVNDSRYFRMNGRLFVPGIGKNHTLHLSQAVQMEPFAAQYKFRDNFFYARGYFASVHDHVTKTGVNYTMPLLYPDLPVGPFLFIKRLRSTFFYDYSVVTRNAFNINDVTPLTPVTLRATAGHKQDVFRSVGAEVIFDVRFMRSLEVSTGFRYSRLLDAQFGKDNRNQFDFLLLNVSL